MSPWSMIAYLQRRFEKKLFGATESVAPNEACVKPFDLTVPQNADFNSNIFRDLKKP
jgi:hypothetical protein